MAKITIYTTEHCPKCNKLKTHLQANSIPFDVADMSNPEALTELRFNGVFSITAPVLQVGNRFFESREIFETGKIKSEINGEPLSELINRLMGEPELEFGDVEYNDPY